MEKDTKEILESKISQTILPEEYIFTKIFKLYQLLKWLDIHKDFWTISCGKMVQYSQIVYTQKTLLSKNWFYFFFSHLLI